MSIRLKIESFYKINANKIVWCIILLGILVKLRLYWFNRSLWLDESMLSLNIINRTFAQLFTPLHYNQMAPIGFLTGVKICTLAFGTSEFGLRLFPLISAITALYIFYLILNRKYDSNTTLLGVALMALSYPILYYSCEVKQYTTDLLVSVLCYYLFVSNNIVRHKTIFFIASSFIAAIFVWFSYPSIFILSGITGYYIIRYTRPFSKTYLLKLSVWCLFWLISFGIQYFMFLKSDTNRVSMESFHEDSFMPLKISTKEDLEWFLSIPDELVVNTIGMRYSGFLLVFFIVCAFVFSKKSHRTILLAYLFPFFLVLVASGIKMYPYKDRLLLFLTPCIIYLSIYSTQLFTKIVNKEFKTQLQVLIAIFLLWQSTFIQLFQFIKPNEKEEIKQVLKYFKENVKKGEPIFVYDQSRYAFDYYKNSYISKDNAIIYGKNYNNTAQGNENDAVMLSNMGKVWILYTHDFDNNERRFIHSISKRGRLIRKKMVEGASIYYFWIQ